MRDITPHLWFDTEAAEAAAFYCETFPDSRVTSTATLPDTPSGDAQTVSFELFGQSFMAISAGPRSDEQVARVTAAFLQMKRFDLAELQRVHDGAAAGS